MDKILVVDFGSQYNQLICRRVREMGVYAELISRKTSIDTFKDQSVKGIIFTGGPKSVYDKDAYTIDKKIYQLKKPILGICYGHQRICQDLGGKVGKAKKSEYGKSIVHYHTASLLFADIPNDSVFWMSHSDEIVEMPKDFELLASTETNKYTVMRKDNIYSTQFHPEVMHSKYGRKLMSNFVLKICCAKPEFSMENYQNILIQNIKDEVKDKKVLCGISGGVDSTVVATLVHKAIGDNLTCMFIDHGLLRKNERESVEKVFGKLNINLVVVDAKENFLSKLKGVSEPEKKRKIIGNEFIYTFEKECKKIGNFDYLAQGTLYTDVIESGVTGTSNTIKSHHNVGGLPEKMHFKLIEPLNTLFKDEARQLGRVLGLPDNMVNRQPFPGPGLAIRIIGDITDDKLRIVKESDQILRDILDKEKGIWQYFTVLTNIKSVGVVGDQRSYNYTVAIRAVSSIDGMTADFSRLDWEVLAKVSNRITNEVKGVNRVVYDITSKPPATIEWE